MEATGWTYPTIDELGISEVMELTHHWSQEPPLGVVVRHWLGVAPPSEPEPSSPPSAPRELTEAEWQRQVAALQAMSAKYGSAHG